MTQAAEHPTLQDLVLDGRIVRDGYRSMASEQELQAFLQHAQAVGTDSAGQAHAGPGLLVPLPVMRACQAEFLAWRGRKGVLVQAGDDPESFVADLPQLDVIAVQFPLFTDGRGHSLARTLRDHYGYQGELRALGDVFEDTVHYLARCGFNAFVPRPGVTAAQILQGLHTFSESYQAAVDSPSPLFRRRVAAHREEERKPLAVPGSAP